MHIHVEMCTFIYVHTRAPHLFCFPGEDRLIQLSLNINSLLPLPKKSQVLPSVLDTCLKGGVPLPTLGRS